MYKRQIQNSGGNFKIAGIPMIGNNTVPSNLTAGTATDLSCVALGPWADYVMAIWRSLRIDYNHLSEELWSHDLVEMRMILEMDYLNTRPYHFVFCRDLQLADV